MTVAKPDRTDEFVRQVTLHQTRLYGHIYALVQNAADADDLVQKTVLTLWKRFDEFESGTDFGAWAWTTARFEVLNFLKTRNRSRVFFGDALSESLIERATADDVLTVDEDRLGALHNCVNALPDADRQLLDLRYERDLKVKELAKQFNRSPQSVTNSLKRIRMAVFRCIARRLSRDESL